MRIKLLAQCRAALPSVCVHKHMIMTTDLNGLVELVEQLMLLDSDTKAH